MSRPPAGRARPRRPGGWGPVASLLAATLLRTLPLMDNRFHPDEALYATFARHIASGHGILLSYLVVDKPPLSFYLAGLSVVIFGGNEFAVRLPNLFASLISVALLFALARRLYDLPTAHLAAWVLALSPFAILFSITVFIDPLLTAFVLGGLWAALRQRPGWTGFTFGLAFATKQTALLFIPLALAFVLAVQPGTTRPSTALRQLMRFALPTLAWLALALLAILAWDQLRHAPIGFWKQGYADNMPGRWIRANEFLPRARAWLDLLHYFTASSTLNLLFGLCLPLLLLTSLLHPSRAALADFALSGYLLLYLAGYWLLAFNVWDRYLVPVLPLLALLFARVMRLIAYTFAQVAYRLARALWPRALKPAPWTLRLAPCTARLLPFAFYLLLVPPALSAVHSGYPIGGDHGAYDGIDDVARFIRRLPTQGVLYDHWLSWEFDFYLFDRPLYIAWFPTPDALTSDLKAFGPTSPRYLVVPSWESEAEVRAAAAQAGFEFVPLHTTARRDGSTSFVVYQLVPTRR